MAYRARAAAIYTSAADARPLSHAHMLPSHLHPTRALLVASASGINGINGASACGGEARLAFSRPGDGAARKYSIDKLETCPHTPNDLSRNQYSSPYLLTDFQSTSPPERQSFDLCSAVSTADEAANTAVYAHHRTRQLRPAAEWMPPPPQFVEPPPTPSRALSASRRTLRDASNYYHAAGASLWCGDVANFRPTTAPPPASPNQAAERARQQARSDIFGPSHHC